MSKCWEPTNLLPGQLLQTDLLLADGRYAVGELVYETEAGLCLEIKVKAGKYNRFISFSDIYTGKVKLRTIENHESLEREVVAECRNRKSFP